MAAQKKSYGCLLVFWIIFLALTGYSGFNFWVIYTGNPDYGSVGEIIGGAFATALGTVMTGLFTAVFGVIFLLLFFIWICKISKK